MQAVSINEFHAPRWGRLYTATPPVTLGRAVLGATDLDSYGLFVLIGIGALVGYVVVYNLVIVMAMRVLSCEKSPLHACILEHCLRL